MREKQRREKEKKGVEEDGEQMKLFRFTSYFMVWCCIVFEY